MAKISSKAYHIKDITEEEVEDTQIAKEIEKIVEGVESIAEKDIHKIPGMEDGAAFPALSGTAAALSVLGGPVGMAVGTTAGTVAAGLSGAGALSGAAAYAGLDKDEEETGGEIRRWRAILEKEARRRDFKLSDDILTDGKFLKKGSVMLDFCIMKRREYVIESLFAKSKLLYDYDKIEGTVLCIPKEKVSREIEKNTEREISNFEEILESLKRFEAIPVKFPFTIVGVSEKGGREVVELTSEVDSFFLDSVGRTFEEVKNRLEDDKSEFKRSMPSDPKKIGKEICAFANKKGGNIIFGVDDKGKTFGLPKEKIDEEKNRIVNMVDDSFSPSMMDNISIDKLRLNEPGMNGEFIMTITVQEVKNKPCVYSDRVYVRSDTQARPAGSKEIRNLIL